jgi:hypothetical protein
MDIKIKDFIGERCITMDAGKRLYDLIHPCLTKGEAVRLDFGGVRIYASPFFNFAIGQLLKDLKSDDLNRLLKIQGMSGNGDMVLRRVIENSKEYYANPDARKAVDDVLMRKAVEA